MAPKKPGNAITPVVAPGVIPTSDAVPASALYREIGTTGLQHYGGFVIADFIPQLIGQSGARAYQEMAQNHPIVAGMLFAMTSIIRNVKWRIELPVGVTNPQAQKRADALGHACFDQLDSPWQEMVAEACTMFTYGYAPCEVTYRKDPDGMWPHKIALRSQETINRWQYDPENRDLLGLWQMDYIHPLTFVPMEKIINFRTTSERDNPEGRSLLRGAYTAYKRQQVIEAAEGRAAMRAAGIVLWRIPQEILEATAGDDLLTKQSYLQAVNNSATDRQGAYLLPSTRDDKGNYYYDMQYVAAASTKSIEMDPIIQRLDRRIASTVLADFILLGQTASGQGSFALSTDKTDMFTQALSAFVRVIEATVTRQLFRRTWAINGWPDEECPKLVGGELDKRDLGSLGAFVTACAGAGMPLFPDDTLEDYLRDEAGFPPKDPKAKPMPMQAMRGPANPPPPPVPFKGGKGGPKPAVGAGGPPTPPGTKPPVDDIDPAPRGK